MAKVNTSYVEASLKVTVELSYEECAALDGIFGYNVEAFLAAFYEKMGKAYVQPYEEGVRSLHASIRGAMAGPLADFKKASTVMRQAMKPKSK